MKTDIIFKSDDFSFMQEDWDNVPHIPRVGDTVLLRYTKYLSGYESRSGIAPFRVAEVSGYISGMVEDEEDNRVLNVDISVVPV